MTCVSKSNHYSPGKSTFVQIALLLPTAFDVAITVKYCQSTRGARKSKIDGRADTHTSIASSSLVLV